MNWKTALLHSLPKSQRDTTANSEYRDPFPLPPHPNHFAHPCSSSTRLAIIFETEANCSFGRRKPPQKGPEGSSPNLAVLSPTGASAAWWAGGGRGRLAFLLDQVIHAQHQGSISRRGRAWAAPWTLVILTDSREETEAREVISKGKEQLHSSKN